MDAAARIQQALQAEARAALNGLPEGRARQDPLAAWLQNVALKLGYDVVTIQRWLDGKNAPTLQSYFDLCDMFEGFAQRVRPDNENDDYKRGYDAGHNDACEAMLEHVQDMRDGR